MFTDYRLPINAAELQALGCWLLAVSFWLLAVGFWHYTLNTKQNDNDNENDNS